MIQSEIQKGFDVKGRETHGAGAQAADAPKAAGKSERRIPQDFRQLMVEEHFRLPWFLSIFLMKKSLDPHE